MKYDYRKLYTKNREFLEEHGRFKRVVLLVNAYLPYLFTLAYALLLGFGTFGKSITPKELSKLFYLPLTALVLASVLQIAVARPRPYQEEGAAISPLKEKGSRDNSLPSRHVASAAVIAVCTLPHFLFVGLFLLACTLAVGYCRFAVGWHYPLDLFLGFALGTVVGCATFLL